MLDFDPLLGTVEKLPAPLGSGGFDPPTPKLPFEDEIRAASQLTGIPESLLRAKIQRESNFNPNAIGGVGEIGLAQIRPSTAADPGYGVKPIPVEDLRDPAKNALFGAQYLAARGKAAGVKDWNDPAQAALGLTAYNGGGPNYAASVMRNMQPGPMTAPAPPAAAAAAPAPEQPQMRPFFRPPTVPVRPGVDLDNIGEGPRGILGALSKLNVPGLEIVSGFRDPARNARVGGAKGSQHIHGNAIDINIEKLSPEDRERVIDAAISAGARGIGIYPGGRSLHFDTRETPAAWGANPRAPYSGVSDPNAYPEWARRPLSRLLGGEVQVARAPQEPATAEVVPASMGRGIGGSTVRSPMADRIMAGLDRPGANAAPDTGVEVASATAFAPAAQRPNLPPAITRPSQGAQPMASPLMSAAASGPPSSMERPAAASDAPTGPAWAQNIDWDGLMMSLALIDNAIPRGVQSRGIGEVVSPFMAAQARREDRRAQQARDAKLDQRDARDFGFRQTEAQRQAEQWRQNFDMQREAQRRADEAAARQQALAERQLGMPIFKDGVDPAGNPITRRWDPQTQRLVPVEDAAQPSTAPQPQPQPMVPPAPLDLNGPLPAPVIPPPGPAPGAAPAQPAPGPTSSIRPAPPGVNRATWYKQETERLAAEGASPKWDDISGLRKEIQQLPSYKNMAQAAPIYRSMADAAGRDDRAADVNLIYGLGKIMDPTSVVREGEMSLAQAIATLPQQIRQTVESQIATTGRLSQDVREGIMREAYSRINAYKGMFDQDVADFRGIAQRRRMDPADVIPNFGEFKPWERPKKDGAAASPDAPAGSVPPSTATPGSVPQPTAKERANVELINRSRLQRGLPPKILTPEDALKYPPGTQIELPDGKPGWVPAR